LPEVLEAFLLEALEAFLLEALEAFLLEGVEAFLLEVLEGQPVFPQSPAGAALPLEKTLRLCWP
tara:strand:- start:107 stop:298 length:192 start_codon:yes stop_codon:yes gene_type:complete